MEPSELEVVKAELTLARTRIAEYERSSAIKRQAGFWLFAGGVFVGLALGISGTIGVRALLDLVLNFFSFG